MFWLPENPTNSGLISTRSLDLEGCWHWLRITALSGLEFLLWVSYKHSSRKKGKEAAEAMSVPVSFHTSCWLSPILHQEMKGSQKEFPYYEVFGVG